MRYDYVRSRAVLFISQVTYTGCVPVYVMRIYYVCTSLSCVHECEFNLTLSANMADVIQYWACQLKLHEFFRTGGYASNVNV